MPMMPISDRLQALLDRAREVNEIERNRVSLESFLAGFHEEDENLDEAQLGQIQLSIYETCLDLFNTAGSVPQATPASAVIASRAVQTDAATISLWDLLPKARKKAYDRGFNAGKDDGHVQGIKEGKSAGITEGLAIGLEQGRAERLRKGLEQGEQVEMQRDIVIGIKPAFSDCLDEVRMHAKKTKNLGEEDTRRYMLQRGAAREEIVVRLPPAPTASITKKSNETIKPKSNGVDPFASLLGLVLKK